VPKALKKALDGLEAVAVAVIVDDEGDVMVVASSDPDADVRRMRSVMKHGLGLEAVAWAHCKDAARLIADAARGRLVKAGFRMRGRWVTCRPDDALAAVLGEADDHGLTLINDAGRLRQAAAAMERAMRRWER
jgi:hypothetical protein